jgi:hypothetical protein
MQQLEEKNFAGSQTLRMTIVSPLGPQPQQSANSFDENISNVLVKNPGIDEFEAMLPTTDN